MGMASFSSSATLSLGGAEGGGAGWPRELPARRKLNDAATIAAFQKQQTGKRCLILELVLGLRVFIFFRLSAWFHG
jgi:hypothetical protein